MLCSCLLESYSSVKSNLALSPITHMTSCPPGLFHMSTTPHINSFAPTPPGSPGQDSRRRGAPCLFHPSRKRKTKE